MSLRTRLLAALAVVLAALLGVGVVVNVAQQRFLVGQLDEQLRSLEPRFEFFLQRSTDVTSTPRGGGPPQLSEVYLGRLEGGDLTTITTPGGDDGFRPRLSDTPQLDSPFTSPADGSSGDARVLVVPLSDGSAAVVAVAMEPVADASRRLLAASWLGTLVIAAFVALAVLWVFRLGLRPIRQMTHAADAISAGDTGRRVPLDGLPSQSEAARLGRALNTMLDANQNGERRLRQFVADASHELRTPLTTLRGYSALYRSGGLSGDALADAMRRIDAESTRMSRMVDDLLLLAELDEHHGLRAESVDLAVVLRDVVEDLHVVHPDWAITVEAVDGLFVTGDGDRIVQAVMVYATNALAHTPGTTAIELVACHRGDNVRIEVVDHGPGVPADDQPYVFERFYRVDRSRTRSSGGNGLGLAIVASIVKAHGGSCGVSNTPGTGATFWLELPRSR